jgi:hypothetical protein
MAHHPCEASLNHLDHQKKIQLTSKNWFFGASAQALRTLNKRFNTCLGSFLVVRSTPDNTKAGQAFGKSN